MLFSVLLVASCFIMSCSKQDNTVLLVTNQPSFASYAELFNSSQSEYRVVVSYQENPVDIFSSDSTVNADIVVGPWLKNEKNRKNFTPLNSLFSEELLNAENFYSQLLSLGTIDDKQYLIPVSFNLPTLIFSSQNSSSIDDNFKISVEEIRQLSSEFNKKNKKGEYTAMGFSPRWDDEFLYVVSKLFGTNYAENDDLFSYNSEAMAMTVAYLKEWCTTENTSNQIEDDFQFKYMYNPIYKLVTSGRCLFGFIFSDQLFTLASDRLQNIDFRWIEEGGKIAVADKLVYLGLHKKSKDKKAAKAFIEWFFKDETQKSLLERNAKMNLSTKVFGISGGFSSIKNVNEKIFPLYYPLLYGHMPDSESLQVPNILPEKWEDIKKRIILPYLSESVVSAPNSPVVSIEERKKEWEKQNY